jgi:hypothetical protein
MSPALRNALLCCAAACLALAAGCGGPQPHPLKQLRPEPATFKVTAATNVLFNYGGNLEERPVNRNVVPARDAVSVMKALGYKYVPGGPARYDIHADLLCYDPQLAATAHAQEEALDVVEPVGADAFTRSVDRAVVQQTWYQYPKREAPKMCVGRVHLTVKVNTGEGDQELFQGGVYTPECPYENDCAYNACEEQLQKKLEQVLRKVF